MTTRKTLRVAGSEHYRPRRKFPDDPALRKKMALACRKRMKEKKQKI
jgi:hypothetical protein